MAEVYVERVHTEHAVLDIGEDIGALVIYSRQELRGRQIEVSPKRNAAKRTHTDVLERRANGRPVFAALFLALPEGDYYIWGNGPQPIGDVTITGGAVTEVDWRNLFFDAQVPSTEHPHLHRKSAFPQESTSGNSPTAPRDAASMLPPRYRNGQRVSAAPMGSAPMRYADDGQVAWNEMWTDFCDLALAGGPPHRDSLLEPVTPDEVRADLEAYERVVAEIERGLRLVTALPTVRSEKLGWIGLACQDEEMALWLLRAIVVENICVRREKNVLFLPAGPAFRLEKEIKNVITAVAKTHHYWTEHSCV
jgi:hypothetical protein